ncbi:MAG: PqqD family protein [Candidatus Omnitrophota bacterium]
MKAKVRLDNIYKHSDGVVTRDLDGEFILIPLFSEIGGTQEDIFSFNKLGKVVWSEFDSKHTLRQIIQTLATRYDASCATIEKDVLGITRELLKRKLLVEAK